MTNIKLIFVLVIGTIGSVCVQAKQSNAEYRLVWEENFASTELNAEHWNVEIDGNGSGNNELQYYRRENISIGQEPVSGKNCLIITAKKENYSGRNATSGRLTTQGKVSFKYGKIEARIKMPKTANGLWPAFWLLGADYPTVGWPRSGEIDILEMGHGNGIRNGTQDRLFNGACHWGYYHPTQGWYPSHAQDRVNPYGLQDDFHLFTLIWDTEFLKMYVDLDKDPDAEPYFEIGITDKSSDIGTYYYFNKPYFVILNLAVGGHFPGILDINKVTALNNGDAYMYVDYVRLFQKGDNGEEYDGPALELSIENKEEKADQLVIYPNPAKSIIEIKGIKGLLIKGSIVNLSGQEVKRFSGHRSVDVSSLLSGLYILKIENEEGSVYSSTFIKE